MTELFKPMTFKESFTGRLNVEVQVCHRHDHCAKLHIRPARLVGQSVHLYVHTSVSWSVSQSVSQLVGLLVGQAIRQSLSEPDSHSVRQLVH